VYVGLGKSLGLIPHDGNKSTHPKKRNLCKAIVLAINYGMGAAGLARRIGKPETVAANLLRRHRETYPRFWKWSDATLDYARIHRRLWTKYGWSVWCSPRSKDNTWRNWRMQATGGEVLRVAVCALGAAGFQIDATVHDSIILEVDAGDAQTAGEIAEGLMVASSGSVLGEPLRVDRRLVLPGERLLDSGPPTDTWNRIWRLLGALPPSELFSKDSLSTPSDSLGATPSDSLPHP
jgi:DNA polymerase I-like protein with 3'-5' exonuclease and polymerase domains